MYVYTFMKIVCVNLFSMCINLQAIVLVAQYKTYDTSLTLSENQVDINSGIEDMTYIHILIIYKSYISNMKWTFVALPRAPQRARCRRSRGALGPAPPALRGQSPPWSRGCSHRSSCSWTLGRNLGNLGNLVPKTGEKPGEKPSTWGKTMKNLGFWSSQKNRCAFFRHSAEPTEDSEAVWRSSGESQW